MLVYSIHFDQVCKCVMKWHEMYIASFLGLPTIQFLTTYSMQKVNGRKDWERHTSMHAHLP